MTSEPTTPPSPLAEASPESLDLLIGTRRLEELLSANPLDLLREDEATAGTTAPSRNIETIVAVLRAQRAKWKSDEAAGATRASAPKAARKPKVSVTLDDLGLGD